MTDQEKAVIMAYTGYCMLSGEKFNIFHKYVEKIMERPIWTHELPVIIGPWQSDSYNHQT